ncbi:MAG: RraA family protein [Alphaproteobacteria bacterium]|nr:RraA family protein [Alphaproteobacteria bacterium]
MPLYRRIVDFPVLPAETVATARGLAASLLGDAMNRAGIMAAAIKPVAPGTRLAGQAHTVSSMAGDNGIIHAAIPHVRAGEVLVVDAARVDDVAVWGEIMTHAAMQRGIAGLVLDGAIRDVAAIRELGFAVYCRAVVPRGPHKGFGGTIDAPIACGGVPVAPGDLIVGDDDGIAVVPLADVERVLAAAQAAEAREAATMAKIEGGMTSAEILGIPEPEIVDGE